VERKLAHRLLVHFPSHVDEITRREDTLGTQEPAASSSAEPSRLIAQFINDDLIEDMDDIDFSAQPSPHLPEFLDSQALLELAGFLEYEFEIEIDDEEIILDNFATIPDLVRLIDRKRSLAAG
jgi:acyl carrier protein